MTFRLPNRVRGTSTTVGTGTYTIGAAPVGFQGFSDLPNNSEVYYCAENGIDWEVGRGTVTVGGSTLLTRTTILESSNADAAVNWGSGSKNLFVVIPGEQIIDILAAIDAIEADIADHQDLLDGDYLSFDPGLTGATGVSGTFRYSIVSGRAYLWAATDILGVADANTFVFTGVPAEIRPGASHFISGLAYDNGIVLASFEVKTDGTIVGAKATDSTTPAISFSTTGWLASVSNKGFLGGMELTYRL